MENAISAHQNESMLSYEDFRNEVLKDYRIALESREVSLLGRREVLTGRAKFGIFGDGKEVAQVAMAKFFKPGDWRSGYYRDQTFVFATGISTPQQFFAQLYADPDIDHEPFSGGRQMCSHYASRNFNEDGTILPLAHEKNVAADMAPTAAHMPHSVGLALASKLFRNSDVLKDYTHLSINGNEICFCTIGDASTSEGHFWEAINAAGVLQVPLAVFIWDDGYGISVPVKYQTTKGSISAALRGLQKRYDTNGIEIYNVKGWDYASMCEVFESGLQKIRETHVPAVFHVEELTQPQGHSTSGSHERYKTAERLEWEREWDCIKKMRTWIIASSIATYDELTAIEETAKHNVKQSRNLAWEEYINPIKEQATKTTEIIKSTVVNDIENYNQLQKIAKELERNREPLRRDIMRSLFLAIDAAKNSPSATQLKDYYNELKEQNKSLYNSWLHNEGSSSALNLK